MYDLPKALLALPMPLFAPFGEHLVPALLRLKGVLDALSLFKGVVLLVLHLLSLAFVQFGVPI